MVDPSETVLAPHHGHTFMPTFRSELRPHFGQVTMNVWGKSNSGSLSSGELFAVVGEACGGTGGGPGIVGLSMNTSALHLGHRTVAPTMSSLAVNFTQQLLQRKVIMIVDSLFALLEANKESPKE